MMRPTIEIEAISEDGKKGLITILNKVVKVEYGMITNYPRIVDYFVSIEKINDEAFLSYLEMIGKESTRHLGLVIDIVKSLGGEPGWQMGVIEKTFDAREHGTQQLEREKEAVELYKQAILVARNNTVKEKVEEFSGKYIKSGKGGLQQEVRKASEVISILERIEADEIRHVRVVEDMLKTYSFLSGGS
ncbi:ferritin-like domain-containing protein [Chloroflexota bacterium]